MSKEQRDRLLQEVEAIRASIEILQPVYEQQVRLSAGVEGIEAKLLKLRKQLARKMELLHAA